MKVPDIDPELHGLLDEVVTDPRSALRRTPRRALLQWLGNPDSAHARPIDATTAERHLVAVYRESLAEIFRTAALLAFLREARLCHPWRDLHGKKLDSEQTGRLLQTKARRSAEFGLRWPDDLTPAAALISLCSNSIESGAAGHFARMAVQSHPGEFERFALAMTMPRGDLLEAMRILQGLVTDARAPHRRVDALNDLAAKMVGLDWLGLARDQYERAIEISPGSPEPRCYALNLSCFLQDWAKTLEHSRALEEVVSLGDSRVEEAAGIISKWVGSRPLPAVTKTTRFLRAIEDRLSPPARRLMESIQ